MFDLKSMKIKKTILLLAFVILFSRINAQTAPPTEEKKKNEQKPSSKKPQVMTRERLIAEHKQHAIIRQHSTMKSRSHDDIVVKQDEYMGKGNDLAGIFIAGKIPGDFPKHIMGQTSKDYNDNVSTYLKQHKELIKDEWKTKVDNNGTIIE